MIEYLISATLGLLVYMTLWYWYATKEHNMGLVDVAYAIGFVVLALGLLINNPYNLVISIVCALVIVWGLRLALHIAQRNSGKPEDWRYQNLRKKWSKSFAIKSYIYVFVFQAFIILIISAPLIILAGVNNAKFGWLQYIGLIIWVIGFLYELIADRQLAEFIKYKKSSKAPIMKSGLWRYSRHPNYFGEVVLWWGLWLMVANYPYGLLAIVSPLLITYLINFVSGIPLLEKKRKDDPEYQKYSKTTSIFIPLPPAKRIKK